MYGRKFTAHHPRITSPKAIRVIIFGIFQRLIGIRARFSGNLLSHQKKMGKRIRPMMIGARNEAVVQPYEAPIVRPTMMRRIEVSILFRQLWRWEQDSGNLTGERRWDQDASILLYRQVHVKSLPEV